jgi:hypothetical protein
MPCLYFHGCHLLNFPTGVLDCIIRCEFIVLLPTCVRQCFLFNSPAGRGDFFDDILCCKFSFGGPHSICSGIVICIEEFGSYSIRTCSMGVLTKCVLECRLFNCPTRPGDFWIVFYIVYVCGCPCQVCLGMSSVQLSTQAMIFWIVFYIVYFLWVSSTTCAQECLQHKYPAGRGVFWIVFYVVYVLWRPLPSVFRNVVCSTF